MSTLTKTIWLLLTIVFAWGQSSTLTRTTRAVEPAETSDFAAANAVLSRYCAGCHNESDKDGDFSVASFGSLMNGTPDGAVVRAGSPGESRILDLIEGKVEPKMPPEDEEQLTEAEIETLRKWIEAGAHGPSETSEEAMLLARPDVPKLPVAKQQFVTGVAAVGGSAVATASLGTVTLSRLDDASVLWRLDSFAGKVNSLRLSSGGKQLVVGSGVTGRAGQVSIVDGSSGRVIEQFTAHNDAIYCASLSPDGKMLATGSYDRQVMLWDVSGEAAQRIHTFTGHNGAVYDLDFSPDGSVLATASADQTIKLWNTKSLSRLDTLGQPEGEMRCVRISLDGRFVIAGGSDRQIRKWKLVSTSKPAINPMVYARFAHEKGITQMVLLGDRHVATASEDQSVKIWNGGDLSIASLPVALSDVPSGLASLGDARCLVVELTGKQHVLSLNLGEAAAAASGESVGKSAPAMDKASQIAQLGSGATVRESVAIQETEPNDKPSSATDIELPALVRGNIELVTPGRGAEDFYRFHAKAGERWIFDVNAPADSKVDSWIEVVDETGGSILQTRLQALRESYFTFRGKDSDTSDDFRMHKWEDMELDEYLYSSGEVTRLWLYPRGPDSGFKVYPGRGKRATFFDTTPVSHALGETAYVVRPLAVEESPLPNGLPVFPIYFENDDDPLRRDGKDSRLEFVAPRSASYVLRVRDARGFGGDDFQYEIDIRRPKPDFKISIGNTKLAMPVSSGREWSVTATRLDGLDGAIKVHVDGLPEGFLATNPLIIEAGQTQALGTIYATEEALEAMRQHETADEAVASDGDEKESPPARYKTVKLNLVASANAHGRDITHELEQTISLTLTDDKEVTFKLVAASDPTQQIDTLTVHPGQTISARLVVDRNGKDDPISFGKDDAGRNLPHGSYVDNIGLNGLLIPGGQTEREFFITAAPKVQPGTRVFHLRVESSKSTSWPVLLQVVEPSSVVQN